MKNQTNMLIMNLLAGIVILGVFISSLEIIRIYRVRENKRRKQELDKYLEEDKNEEINDVENCHTT